MADDKDWSELSSRERHAAATLGYTKKKWDSGASVPCEDKSWSKLSDAQRQAATLLGYGPQEKWDASSSDSDEIQEAYLPVGIVPNTEQEDTILIIGAGMAGLSAANQLRALGKKVTILEARDRIGGRIFTDRSIDGIAMDLGASWIHGDSPQNPVANMARSLGVRMVATHTTTEGDDNQRKIIVTGSGARLSDKVEAEVSCIVESVMEYVESLQESSESDLTLEEGIEMAFAKKCPSLNADMKHFAMSHFMAEVSEEYGASLSNLSLWNYNQDEDMPGKHVVVPDGYDHLITKLAEGLDIRFGVVVRRVLYGTHSCCTVEDMTGTQRYTAAKVLVTVPLGVLQAGSILFEPPLPPAKQLSIQRLQMGVLTKAWLVFPTAFWAEVCGASPWLYYWGEPETLNEFLNMEPILGKPVLVALLTETVGRRYEAMPGEEAITQEAIRVLRIMFPNAVPPTAVKVTRWSTDPFALGSYSHVPKNASGKDYRELAKPVGTTLFFAGEATHRRYPATVTGAYLSGQEVANRMSGMA